jgi:hypothetical protein
VPDLWDTNPDHVFSTIGEQPDPALTTTSTRVKEVKLKDPSGKLRPPAYPLIALAIALAAVLLAIAGLLLAWIAPWSTCGGLPGQDDEAAGVRSL